MSSFCVIYIIYKNKTQKGDDTMKLISIGKFAKILGVTPTTVRRLHKTGELIPCHISAGGTRYYSEDQLKKFISKETENVEKIVIGYCRVSTPSQKDDLETQVNNLKTYMYAKGYKFKIITDIGSGINYNKKGLQELIKKINDKEISKIVILYEDRLIRFGFDLIKYLCELNDVEIEIIDNTEQSKEQELTDDLIQIITVFANRLYGQRSRKTKRLIDEVKTNASRKEDKTASNT